MKKVFIISAFCANMAMAMMPAEDQLPKLYPQIEVVNKTKHNIFITDADTENIIIRLKPGETKKTTLDYAEHGFYWVESLTAAKSETIGNLYISYNSLLDSPNPSDYFIEVGFRKCRTINNVDAKDNMSDVEEEGDVACQDIEEPDYISVTSSTAQKPQRIDITLKLILEGDDLGQSRIEDLTGVVH